MGKKKRKDGVVLHFIGSNTRGVTGSCIYGECDNDFKFLLECGGYQEGTTLENYRRNYELLTQIDFDKIDILFVCHAHIDHSMLIPVAIKKGFKGRIICTYETSQLLQPLWIDCCHIMKSDCEYLGTKKGYKVEPFYTEIDVQDTLPLICAYDTDNIHELKEYNIQFRLLKNNHILGACQLELFYMDKASHQHKLLYTSDLGNTVVDKHYVSDIEYSKSATVAIFESTYGSSKKSITKKDRKEDLEILKHEIENTLFQKHGTVVIPAFAMDRIQNIITYIYDIFKNDERFNNIPVIMDGLLASRITNIYNEVLEGEQLEKLKEVLSWENLKIIHDYKDTKLCLSNQNPQIVISSSGFGDKGHVSQYLKKFVTHKKNTIIMIGYASPKSLSGRLREKDKKYITIENKSFKFEAEVFVLSSFSSHMQQKQLIDYMKQINIGQEIILVHGDLEGREELCKIVKDEISKCGKTTRIVDSQKNMKIRF